MVLFLNVRLDQAVLVQHRGRVIPGKVKYKGHLNQEIGEWVGIALDYPFGKHNGKWRGWQYFTCSDKCGLFTHASNIKFLPSVKRSRNTYRRVSDGTDIDETIFHTEKPSTRFKRYPMSVDMRYINRAKTAFRDSSYADTFCKEKRYPLIHSVGNHIPASTMLNPVTAMKPFNYLSEPIHDEYATSWQNFNPTPSIPHYSMPHEEQLRQKRLAAWDHHGLKQPRFVTV